MRKERKEGGWREPNGGRIDRRQMEKGNGRKKRDSW